MVMLKVSVTSTKNLISFWHRFLKPRDDGDAVLCFGKQRTSFKEEKDKEEEEDK